MSMYATIHSDPSAWGEGVSSDQGGECEVELRRRALVAFPEFESVERGSRTEVIIDGEGVDDSRTATLRAWIEEEWSLVAQTVCG